MFRGSPIKLQIWDSAGQEKYRSLIPSYVRGAAIIFIVYDISSKVLFIKITQSLDKESFDNVTKWLSFIRTVKIEDAKLVLVGNKIDLER